LKTPKYNEKERQHLELAIENRKQQKQMVDVLSDVISDPLIIGSLGKKAIVGIAKKVFQVYQVQVNLTPEKNIANIAAERAGIPLLKNKKQLLLGVNYQKVRQER